MANDEICDGDIWRIQKQSIIVNGVKNVDICHQVFVVDSFVEVIDSVTERKHDSLDGW